MYCGYIVELKSLRKHDNADRLLCTEVFGNNVIVSTDCYHEGQLCVFFPIDGKIGLEFAEKNNLLRKKDENGRNIGGYLDPEKRNIRALKLRGERSEGLLLPIESLSDYANINEFKVGDQITILNGITICEKYIPVNKKSSSDLKGTNDKKQKSKIIDYPLFLEHYDTAQLAYNMNAFRPGDTIYITLKMHGTSNRVGNLIEERRKRNVIRKLFNLPAKINSQWKIISGTRRTIIKDYNNGFYGSNTFRKQYNDFFEDKLPKGFTVYMEIVGYVDDASTPIMGKCSNKLVNDKEFEKMYGKETVFSYGCSEGKSDIYVYRITHTNIDGVVTEIPWEEVKIWCEKWGCKAVPEFEKFLFTSQEDLMERVNRYLEGADPIGKIHTREGVVVRIDNREKFTAYKHKSWYFKVLEGIIKENSQEADMEEAEELIQDE
ncbi:RNA ligase family protein [Clostridium sp.]|uniref:RNA ligase family protein n=1 Tax=Clostridium sp. TaxID=1506 RepID=UPI00321675A5